MKDKKQNNYHLFSLKYFDYQYHYYYFLFLCIFNPQIIFLSLKILINTYFQNECFSKMKLKFLNIYKFRNKNNRPSIGIDYFFIKDLYERKIKNRNNILLFHDYNIERGDEYSLLIQKQKKKL